MDDLKVPGPRREVPQGRAHLDLGGWQAPLLGSCGVGSPAQGTRRQAGLFGRLPPGAPAVSASQTMGLLTSSSENRASKGTQKGCWVTNELLPPSTLPPKGSFPRKGLW